MADPKSSQGSGPQAGAVADEEAGGVQPPRALGRGLEDLSHLFFSRRTEKAPEAEPAAASSADAGQAAAKPRVGLMLLRPVDRLTRSQVIAVLQEPWGAIEEHLRAIDSSLPCSPCGVIDVLAVDAAGRLVVIDIDPFTGDGLLLRGLSHIEWLRLNAANVCRMYPGKTIDFAAPARLVLVAPRFSVTVRHAVSQISELEIECVRYRGFDVSGWTGVFFEPVTDDGR
jgi:hypothetical protein